MKHLLTIIGIIFLVLIGSYLSKNLGKYEGGNAQYWFELYDEENAQLESLKSCIDNYSSMPEEDKHRSVKNGKSLTGRTPEELMKGYIKATEAGDTTNANVLHEMYEDELKYGFDEIYTTVSDYCQ